MTTPIYTLEALKAVLTEMADDQSAVIEGMIATRSLNPDHLWVWKIMLLEEAAFSIQATGPDPTEIFAACEYRDKLMAIHARIKTAEIVTDPIAAGEIHCKRLYVPGVKIKVPCPKCGTVCERDLGYEYLSYPGLGPTAKPSKVYMYCAKCEYEDFAEIPVRVKLTVELDMQAPETEESDDDDS